MISSRVMVSVSPDLPVTTQRPGSSASRQGGDIQFSGLYQPPSECTRTEPSALIMMSLVAGASRADRRPA